MKLNIDQNLLTLDKKPIVFSMNSEGEVTEYATLRNVITRSLMAPLPDGRPASGPDTLKFFSLALRIQDSSEEAELTAEEIVLIKDRIADAFGSTPLVCGQAWALLNV